MIPKSGVRFSDKIMRKEEGGEAPKGACQPLPRNINKRCRSSMSRRGCAPNRGAPAFRRYAAALAGTPIPAQLQAMLPGTWTAHDPKIARRKPAGVTRPLLSQSSDSTSRLGRSTEGNDAQSRPGAGCKPARRHRTRSASESALAKASLDERDFRFVTEIETIVNVNVTGYDPPSRNMVASDGQTGCLLRCSWHSHNGLNSR